MEHDVMDRLRAARPHAARADESAFDAELLERVRRQPIAARRTVPRAVAVPVAAGATLTVTAVVMLAGGPGEVGGPSSASAITQALQWLNPPAGTVLHVRSVETMGGHTTTRELWRSADHPEFARLVTAGAQTSETSGDAFYDAATDTIYDPVDPKQPPGKKATAFGEPPEVDNLPAADPMVDKVRILLQEGHMSVSGRELHDGVETWKVSLNADAGRPIWTLWVSAADGKPLELRDPGRDASEQAQTIRWPTYEVLPGADADRLVSLRGAHPTARVVHDPVQVAAAEQRLMPAKP